MANVCYQLDIQTTSSESLDASSGTIIKSSRGCGKTTIPDDLSYFQLLKEGSQNQ